MNIRSLGAAIGASVLIAASVPGAAHAAGLYPPLPPKTTCSAKAVSTASKIRVTIGPALASGQSYKFRIEKRVDSSWLRANKTYAIQSPNLTRTVNVKKGKYRIKCYTTSFPVSSPAFDSTSNVVKIKK